METLAKLEPDRGLGRLVVMCDLCGRPISVPSPEAQGRLGDYDREANFPHEDGRGKGRHVACQMKHLRTLELQKAAVEASLTPEEREEREAQRFNNAPDTVDQRPDAVLVRPVISERQTYRGGPPPPIENVPPEGELSASDIRRLQEQAEAREAEIAAQFQLDQEAIAKASSV
jgi:hypothetical protein